jgi:hypothetical protein
MNGGLSAPGGFFADADFDYDARIALGSTVSGALRSCASAWTHS